MLAKIINQEARKQLGLTSGSAENPKCGGIALEYFKRVDLSKADFSEFYQKVVIPNIKIPNVKGDAKANADNVASIKNSAKNLPNERKGFNPSLLENGGISK